MSRRRAQGRYGPVGLLLLGLAIPSTGAAPRSYSLSLEVSYGLQPDRASHLEEIRRAIEAWIAESGPLNAETRPGSADLHLRVVVDRIEVKRSYPDGSFTPDVFADTASPGYPRGIYSTLFETRVELVDLRAGGSPLMHEPLKVYNEQIPGDHIPDAKARSWQVNLDYLCDRIASALRRHRKSIQRHLDAAKEAGATPP
jgi:hypothetical protein